MSRRLKAKDEEHFSQFIIGEPFQNYIRRKRIDGVHGNNPEIQAISELFNRPVEVFVPENGGMLYCLSSRRPCSKEIYPTNLIVLLDFFAIYQKQNPLISFMQSIKLQIHLFVFHTMMGIITMR